MLGLLIAETADVCAAYPTVAPAAVGHLLWALRRALPHFDAGRVGDGLAGLRADLATWPGSFGDFEPLGVPEIFQLASRHDCATVLAGLRLLHGEQPPEPIYVLVGPELAGRVWAQQRHIGRRQVVHVCAERDVTRLHGLDPSRVRVVELAVTGGALRRRLNALHACGAVRLSRRWWPGADPDDGRPQLDLAAGADRPQPAG